jgi:hypothetical protein
VHGLGLNRKRKGKEEDDRWGRDVTQKDQGEERLAARCVEEKSKVRGLAGPRLTHTDG